MRKYHCVCEICGREFTAYKSTTKFCSHECTRKNKIKLDEIWQQTRGFTEPIKRTVMMSIDEVQKAAEREGMSYGKYVALHKLD